MNKVFAIGMALLWGVILLIASYFLLDTVGTVLFSIWYVLAAIFYLIIKFGGNQATSENEQILVALLPKHQFIAGLLLVLTAYLMLIFFFGTYIDPADMPFNKFIIYILLFTGCIIGGQYYNKKIVEHSNYGDEEEASYVRNLRTAVILVFSIFSPFLVNYFITKEKIQIQREYSVTKGILTRYVYSKQGEKIYTYQFMLNNYLYEGNVNEKELFIREGGQNIKSGDSVELLYYPKNPEINRFSDIIRVK